MRRRVKTFATGLVLVMGTATASLAMSSSAQAAQPIVVGDCSTSIQGAPGTPISLSPSAVLSPITDIVNAVPLLGPAITKAINGMGNIPLGAIPNANTTISGGTIASTAVPRIKAAIEKIPLIGGVLTTLIGSVQGALTSGCAIVVTVVNTAVAPVQEGAKTVGGVIEQGVAALPLPGGGGTSPAPGTNKPPAGTPGGGSAPATGGGVTLPGSNQPVLGGVPTSNSSVLGGYDFGRSPMADYSNLPFAKAGLFAPSPGVRYGGAVPGYTPQFGILGANNDTDGVQQAGHADALTPVGGGKIAFPVLLAVLALSGVTAALVRTWVLRRTVA
ncbi:hypothetical protein [Actinokineospora sp. HUAS TT18]|uniref:hypothetical protein n=1 Tax=Actinokineospora sp. HUAS TT18 TaxID=3447451 RepID=UPI003F51C306